MTMELLNGKIIQKLFANVFFVITIVEKNQKNVKNVIKSKKLYVFDICSISHSKENNSES